MRGILVIGHEGSYQGNLATNICAGSAVLHCVSTDQYAEIMGGEEEWQNSYELHGKNYRSNSNSTSNKNLQLRAEM